MRPLLVVMAAALAAAALWFFLLRDGGASAVDAPRPDPTSASGDALSGVDPEAPSLTAREGEEGQPPEEDPLAVDERAVAGGHRLTGRVLDDRRRPVSGATIHLACSHAPTQDGRTATTDDEGRFHMEGVPRAEPLGHAHVLARHKTWVGRATAHLFPQSPDTVEVPEMRLVEGTSVAIQVTDGADSARGGLPVHVDAIGHWGAAPLATVETDPQGRVWVVGLPAGSLRAWTTAPGHGRASAIWSSPRSVEDPVSLVLGASRSLRARVIDKDSEAPIAGARVLVDELVSWHATGRTLIPWQPRPDAWRTDEDGWVEVTGLGGADAIQVNAEAEGYPARGLARGLYALPVDTQEHTVALRRLRTLRFPLAAENPHAPADGTALTLEADPSAVQRQLPASAVVDGEEIVCTACDPGPFHAFAVAPDGAYARLFARREGAHDRAVVFQRPQEVVVRIRRADGTPAAGAYVSARNQGNVVIVPPTRLDDTGLATLTLRYEHLLDVFASTSDGPYSGQAVGSLDLRKPFDGVLQGTLMTARSVTLAFQVDGAARLPPVFYLRGAQVVEEIPHDGVVRVDVHGDPATPRKIHVQAPGFLSQQIEVPTGTVDAPLPVNLSRGGTLVLRIRPPEDGTMRVRPVAQGSDPRRFHMGAEQDQVDLGAEGPWLVRRIAPLAPGTYEALDQESRARSAPFEIREGEVTEARLDLSAVTVVSGHVRVPEGVPVHRARVHVEAPDTARETRGPFAGTPVGRSGTFQVRIPGTQPMRIEASHPSLVPSADLGSVVLKEGRTDVELHLVAGATATLRLDPPVDRLHSSHGQSAVALLLYPETPEGKAPHRVFAFEKDGVWTARGLPEGAWHAVLDVRRRAPLDLGRRTLGPKTDLGLLKTEAGATLRIRVLVSEGQDPPRIFASAHPVSGPAHARWINSRGEAEVLLPGLGPGRYTVRANTMQGLGSPGAPGKGPLDAPIESDGRSEILLELDLR